MDCPDCNGNNTRVTDTYRGNGYTRRSSICRDCGVRWESRETVERTSIVRPKVPIRPQGTPVNHPSTAPPQVVTNPSATANGVGGVGGGLSSGSDLSLFPKSDLLSDRSSNPDQTRARKKRRDAEYTSPQFVAFWELYPRKVSKRAAATAWWKLGLDVSAELVMAGLRAQLADFAKRPPDKVPHAATWLNDERWKDDPFAYAVTTRQVVPRCVWHAKGGRGASRYPTASCPDCKEHQARTAGRSSEPTTIADALPDWAQIRETTQTPSIEELRALRGGK